MKTKQIIWAIVVIALFILAYFFYSFQTTQAPNKAEENIVKNEEVNLNWQSYKNEEFGIEFKYPSDWGQVSSPLPNQIRIKSEEENRPKVVINLENFQPTDLKNGKIALLQVDFECNLNFRTFKEIGNKFFYINMLNTKANVSSEECFELFGRIPAERKEEQLASPHRYTLVYLEENEIPEIMQVDYQEFEMMVASFKNL